MTAVECGSGHCLRVCAIVVPPLALVMFATLLQGTLCLCVIVGCAAVRQQGEAPGLYGLYNPPQLAHLALDGTSTRYGQPVSSEMASQQLSGCVA